MKNTLFFTFFLALLGCHILSRSYVKVDDFKNKRIKFKDYSYLGDDYHYLNGILLKLDSLQFIQYSMDTIAGHPIKLAQYKASVGMKDSRTGVSGQGKPYIFEKDVKMNLFATFDNTEQIYSTMLDSMYQWRRKNDSINIFKLNPTTYSLHNCEDDYLCIKTYAPLKKSGKYEFSLPNKYFKILPGKGGKDNKYYRNWILKFIDSISHEALIFKSKNGCYIKVGENQLPRDFILEFYPQIKNNQ